jgi:hypothetical protein
MEEDMPKTGKMGFTIMDMKMFRGCDTGTTNEIMVGSYYDEGGCDFEIALKWHDLSQTHENTPPTLRVDIYTDAMPYLDRFKPLLTALGELSKSKKAKGGVYGDFDISPQEALVLFKKLRYKNFNPDRELVA